MFKTKTELVAIYRLEFYKNQKDWKFSHDVRKKKSTEKKKTDSGKILNATYDIVADPPDSKEPDPNPEESILNQAFLDSEPVSAEASTFPCEEETTTLPPPNTPNDEEQPWPEWVDWQPWAPPGFSEVDGAPPGFTEADRVPRSLDCGWTCDAQWVDRGLEYRAEEVVREVEVRASHETIQSHSAMGEDQLQQWLFTECPSDLPAARDTESEFMRGAHEVPHSSDNELDDDDCVGEWESSSRTLASLPSKSLVSRGRVAARALRLICAEVRERDLLRESSTLRDQLTITSTFEEPTRDVGFLPQDFISGSHLCKKGVELEGWAALNPLLEGRGRGRRGVSIEGGLRTAEGLNQWRAFPSDRLRPAGGSPCAGRGRGRT